MTSILEDLVIPEAFPEATDDVKVVQTHISIVFIGREFVYKIKKPVNFGFLDFSTLEKRHFYCLREVELNRRFSNDLYMGVVPVFFDAGRHTMREASGEPVEYAVKMRRISEDALMDRVFEKGALTGKAVKEIARFLAGFHSSARRGPEIDIFGEPANFKINTDENFAQVKPFIGQTIESNLYKSLHSWTEDFYQTNWDLFSARIVEGKIRDCHGDLHMQHVSLTNPIQAFDCIEFNDRFRYSDTLADIAFLLMDMEYRGGRDLAEILWDSYRKEALEEGGESLLLFYKVYRAFVRGKVIGFTVNDKAISPDMRRRSAETAASYFHLAESLIQSG
ncbi:MAG: hypothetical protein C4582_12125 [Desulfobacteraceae bacterium]|nr:MAG: hypothetical protein C4582_12125 [Desulfobacteraceae bacterium]